MTLQEIYTTVRRHLLTQNKKALRSSKDNLIDNLCVYRASDGCKCAVGILIPDERYSPELEGRGVVFRQVADAAGVDYVQSSSSDLVCGEAIDLLCRLQNIHDAYPVDRWREQLDRLAQEYSFVIEE